MANLKDFRDGKLPLNNLTTIIYSGAVYRGRKAILELANKVYPPEQAAEKVEDHAAEKPEPKKRSYRKSTTRKRRVRKQPEPAVEQPIQEPQLDDAGELES